MSGKVLQCCQALQFKLQIFWTPLTGFILIVRISPTKRETKRDEMYEKKKSVILVPLFFPTWSNRRMRDRGKLVERRKGKLCWEIKLVIFVQCPAFCWQDCCCWCKKRKKNHGNCPALSSSVLISLPACAGATVFSCSWLRHHCHFYSPFPFAARALHVESALC